MAYSIMPMRGCPLESIRARIPPLSRRERAGVREAKAQTWRGAAHTVPRPRKEGDADALAEGFWSLNRPRMPLQGGLQGGEDGMTSDTRWHAGRVRPTHDARSGG